MKSVVSEGLLGTVTTSNTVRFITMWEKQILARAVGNQKKIGGNHTFSEIIK